MATLLEDSTHMRVRCIDSQGDGCSGYKVRKDRNGGEKELGMMDSGVKFGGPKERFTGTLEGVSERS